MQKPLLGYVIAAAIGAAVFVIVGYLVYTSGGGAYRFGNWLANPMRYSVLLWAGMGLAIGAGVRFLTISR